MNKENKPDTCVYHEVKAPQGIVVTATEAQKLYKKGWVDTPAKFGKGIRSKSRKIIKALSRLWLSHWNWIITTIIAIIGLYLAYLSLIKTK
jgi:hypothetical protein